MRPFEHYRLIAFLSPYCGDRSFITRRVVVKFAAL